MTAVGICSGMFEVGDVDARAAVLAILELHQVIEGALVVDTEGRLHHDVAELRRKQGPLVVQHLAIVLALELLLGDPRRHGILKRLQNKSCRASQGLWLGV